MLIPLEECVVYRKKDDSAMIRKRDPCLERAGMTQLEIASPVYDRLATTK